METTKGATYVVFADFKIPILRRDELFDQETISNLTRFGIVMARHGYSHHMENSFHIIDSRHRHIADAIDTGIIKFAFIHWHYFSEKHILSICYRYLEQRIYDAIPAMCMYLYHQMEIGVLKIRKGEPYLGEKNYRLVFGVGKILGDAQLEIHKKYIDEISSQGKVSVSLFPDEESDPAEHSDILIPTKEVHHPISSFAGGKPFFDSRMEDDLDSERMSDSPQQKKD